MVVGEIKICVLVYITCTRASHQSQPLLCHTVYSGCSPAVVDNGLPVHIQHTRRYNTFAEWRANVYRSLVTSKPCLVCLVSEDILGHERLKFSLSSEM